MHSLLKKECVDVRYRYEKKNAYTYPCVHRQLHWESLPDLILDSIYSLSKMLFSMHFH